MQTEIAEALRYLGRRGHDVPPELVLMVESGFLEMQKAAAPRFIAADFNVLHESGGIFIESAELLLPGNSITHHLDGCRRATVFAATLGVGADNLIRRYENVDITRALVLDACATVLIERFCGEAENTVRIEANRNGLSIKPRYSPGYGDFPLSVQPMILSILDAGRKIGLTCTDNNLMLPRKSVTAVIGICDEYCDSRSGCDFCSKIENCSFRR